MEDQWLDVLRLLSVGQRTPSATVRSQRVVSDSRERSCSANHYSPRVLGTRVDRVRLRCRRAVVRSAADVKPAGLSCRRACVLPVSLAGNPVARSEQ